MRLLCAIVLVLLVGCTSYHALTEAEVNRRLQSLSRDEPDLRRRIVTLARRNLNQPYDIYLLGEAPFETIDNQPVYCLDRSDCVVFAEHTLAMALSNDFPSFLRMLQRIRYKDGAIGVRTRNHYTEADWNVNNRWLEEDITAAIGGSGVMRYRQRVDRSRFFKDRYKLDVTIPVETIEEDFVPYERIDAVKPFLKNGDIVNFVSTKDGGCWVGHVGIVAIGSNGDVHLIHSASPHVGEEAIDDYIARMTRDETEKKREGKAYFRGFKFLRVHDDAIERLKKLDGRDAPRVTVPDESPMSFEAYLASFRM